MIKCGLIKAKFLFRIRISKSDPYPGDYVNPDPKLWLSLRITVGTNALFLMGVSLCTDRLGGETKMSLRDLEDFFIEEGSSNYMVVFLRYCDNQ